MTHKRNAEGLRQNAQRKSQEALKRTNQAINYLLKEGKKINFHAVADAAGVSVAYLYKYDEIKQRINQLRKQQSSIKSLPSKQGTSDESKKAIIATFKQRISDLQAEARGLRDHIEVVEGRAFEVLDLKQQVEALKIENLKLKQQLEVCMTSKSIAHSKESKVTPLSKKKAVAPLTRQQLQSQLDELGIRVNSTLSKLIKSAPEEVVFKAIDALKEAESIYEVRNPSGFLVEAIRNTWKPNEGYEQKIELDTFNDVSSTELKDSGR